MFIVAGLFGLMLAIGLITQSMPLPPYLRFEREEEPLHYWAAAAFDIIIVLLAIYMGVVTR
jgi:hypothetical protein